MKAPMTAHMDRTADAQLLFDQFSTDHELRDITFVIVDVETTGTRAGNDRITEIGAVKVRGGEVLGEFATLVDPGQTIPPTIVRLTGITQEMVHNAPTIEQVLPAFLEFARGTVLVAHNARFDMSFLRAAANRQDQPWTFGPALCTVILARRILTRDEAPRVSLSSLATHFGVASQPTHRALDDARATVEVMHRLFERVGNLGITTYRELRDYRPAPSHSHHIKRSLADNLPAQPGVYLFRGPADEVLYVGTSGDLRRRVQSYITGGDTRRRIAEMVALATRVEHVVCAHPLEAGVRELRLLSAHTPPYNRRSKYPLRGWWICLTDEPFPRFSVCRAGSEVSVGPIRSRSDAYRAADILAMACGLRSCARPIRPDAHHMCGIGSQSDLLFGGCHAATASGEDITAYRRRADAASDTLRGRTGRAIETMVAHLDLLVANELFETAARVRDQMMIAIAALARCQRLAGLCRLSEIVVAHPDGDGGWQLAVIRHGRLAAAGTAPRGAPPLPVVEALVAGAETVTATGGPLRGAPPEEAELLYRWITATGGRIVCSSSGLSVAANSAEGWSSWCTTVRAAHPTATARSPHRATGRPVDSAIIRSH